MHEMEDKDSTKMLLEIAVQLNLPTIYHKGELFVSMKDLWNLLSNEKEWKQLSSFIKNKAFW